MIINNVTTLSSEEAINELVNVERKSYLKKYVFTALLTILGLIVVIYIAIAGEKIDSIIVGILFLIFGIFLTFINTYYILSMKKRIIKKNPLLIDNGLTYSFTFKEESFIVNIIIGKESKKLEYSYKELKKIYEKDGSIYFILIDNTYYRCKIDSFKDKKELELFYYGLSKHKTKYKRK